MSKDKKHHFEEAGQEAELSLFQEFVHMLKHNKKYWMIPLVLMLLAFALLLVLSPTGPAAFIYTFF